MPRPVITSPHRNSRNDMLQHKIPNPKFQHLRHRTDSLRRTSSRQAPVAKFQKAARIVWNLGFEFLWTLELLFPMSAEAIDNFLRLLKKSPSGAVFNPWWRVDEENDIGGNAPGIRRKQLRRYFRKRLGKAKLAIIGEALGYRGGHFSGIPMTSARILLGRSKGFALEPNDLFSVIKPRRTSKPEKCPDGFSEPTATIVWVALLQLGLKPDQFVLWNAF